MKQPAGAIGHRARCFVVLLDLWAPDADLTTVVNAHRRFFVACFDAIREHDASLIIPKFAEIERLMHVLVAREDGELPAWEGLKVVRERRL
jgi:hypothetical protein